MRSLACCLLGAVLVGVTGAATTHGPTEVVENTGTCDASAAVAIDGSLFVVGSDEDNVLRVYRRGQGGEAIASFDVGGYLQLAKKHQEVDIEGAGRIGDIDYWIGSHGRSKDGEDRPNRCRLFATQFKVMNGQVTMTFVGAPYRSLLADLAGAAAYKKYELGKAATRAPKQIDAFNIEGLAATPSGELWIGLRSPIIQGKALLIPLLNPRQVIDGEHARFGDPVELNLGGLGIRSIDYWPARSAYLIIAGPYASGACRLYEWSGRTTDTPKPIEGVDLGDWNAEACVIFPDPARGGVQIICDDGALPENQAVKRSPLGKFRNGWLKL